MSGAGRRLPVLAAEDVLTILDIDALVSDPRLVVKERPT